MPPKAKFTKDEIVNAALNVARSKGLQAVTTRQIASELQVSTRPIFTYFSSMEELRTAMIPAAENRFRPYMERARQDELPLRAFALQYLRFAKEEPELFRLLFLSPLTPESILALKDIVRVRAAVRNRLQNHYQMSARAADRYFRDMWLVAHSLATMLVTGTCTYDLPQLTEVVEDFSASLYNSCKAEKTPEMA